MKEKYNEIVIYKTELGDIKFRADMKKEASEVTQAQMAEVIRVNL